MKLSLVLPASALATACAGAAPAPPVVPLSQLPEPSPVTTTHGCVASPERTEAAPINVTVQAPPEKSVDPALAAAMRRLPPFEQTAQLSSPTALRVIDGKLRLHGRNGYAQVEVTLPTLTTQCEQTLLGAIQAQRPVEVKGKGRVVAASVPGHGYVSAWDLEDVTSCIAR